MADGRCPSLHGQWRCMRPADHSGVHQVDVGRSPAVLRWGMWAYGCADPECIRDPGHAMPHRDGWGKSWVPVEEEIDD